MLLLSLQGSWLSGEVVGAQEPPPAQAAAPPSQEPSTEVSGVTVRAHRTPHVSAVTVKANWCPAPDRERYPAEQPPSVVSSHPGPGAVVPPGVLVVRLTFDQPMACYWAVTTDSEDDDPCTPSGAWELPGRRVFRMRCRLRPSTSYVIHFGAVQGHDFFGMSDRKAEPYSLSFSTSADPPVRALSDALAADPEWKSATPPAGFITCTDLPAKADEAPCRHAASVEDSLPARR